MRRGFSLAELAVVLAALGVIIALALPRWQELLDWVAVDRTAVEVSTALAVTRSAAVLGSTRARLLIADDSLRIDRDRKSTRLNSSHSQISYAVFCLKKKTNTATHLDNSSDR